MPREKYLNDFISKLNEARVTVDRYENMSKYEPEFLSAREEYEYRENLYEGYKKVREDPFLWSKINYPGQDHYWIKSKKEIADYMGVIPFSPCVMINISPNWKGKFGKDKMTDKIMCKKFQSVIEKYLNASHRYTKWKYVLENGSEGNFLHAHIVAEINPKTEKSVITHLNKGNHSGELNKIWNKNMPKGNEGYLKGKFAVQRILLRNEELKKDKLKYLIEENKPEGHKNLTDLGILINSGF